MKKEEEMRHAQEGSPKAEYAPFVSAAARDKALEMQRAALQTVPIYEAKVRDILAMCNSEKISGEVLRFVQRQFQETLQALAQVRAIAEMGPEWVETFNRAYTNS